jgi:hypothetical protein
LTSGSNVKELSELMKTETLTTMSLQVFKSIATILLPRKDPVAIFIANNENKWPETCPNTPLQARISTIQIVLSVLKVNSSIKH